MTDGDGETPVAHGHTVGRIFLLGLLNNTLFVVLNAGAKHIDASSVGLVYVCNTIPMLLMQGAGPYVYHLISYGKRIALGTVMFATSVTMVALGDGVLFWQLLGIVIGALACAMGESSMLGFLGFSGERGISAWSSGTGAAGIFGYAWKAMLVDFLGWSFPTCLLLANVMPLAYFLVFQQVEVPHHESGEQHYVEIGDPNGGAGESRDGAGEGDEALPQESFSFREKLSLFSSLWRFTIPLFVVYVTEYAMQSGTWAAMGFPIDDKHAREVFYTDSNWLYQFGVFVSRSSGTLVTLSLPALWVLPFLQLCLLIFFTLDAVFHFWWSNSILVLCFVVGLLGGSVYVHGYCIMARDIHEHKEFSFTAVPVAASAGTAAATVLAIFIQGCLYRVNSISGK